MCLCKTWSCLCLCKWSQLWLTAQHSTQEAQEMHHSGEVEEREGVILDDREEEEGEEEEEEGGEKVEEEKEER